MKSHAETSSPSTRSSMIQSRRSTQKPSHSKQNSLPGPYPTFHIPTNSDQTDSASTFRNNPKIPHSLNTHRLKLSLRGIYDLDPALRLDKLFRKTQPLTPASTTAEAIPKPKSLKAKKKPKKLDSMFGEKEAELIRSELNTIRSPKVWQQVIKNFKQSPNILLDLVPVE
jgi:hypothetical protein